MKVKFVRGTFAPGGAQRLPGDVAELEDSMAKEIVRMGKAVPAGAKDEIKAPAMVRRLVPKSKRSA